jgi:hypothetical protein
MILIMSPGCHRQTAAPCVNVSQSTPAPAASPGSIDQGDFKVVFAPRHRKPGTERGTNPQYWQDLVDDLNRDLDAVRYDDQLPVLRRGRCLLRP